MDTTRPPGRPRKPPQTEPVRDVSAAGVYAELWERLHMYCRRRKISHGEALNRLLQSALDREEASY